MLIMTTLNPGELVSSY